MGEEALMVGTDPHNSQGMTTSQHPIKWVTSAEAVTALGLSPYQLRHSIKTGLFQPAVHFMPGPTPTSPRRYNLEAISQLLLGQKAQQSEDLLSSLTDKELRTHEIAVRAEIAKRRVEAF
jgi:hypothetical protein